MKKTNFPIFSISCEISSVNLSSPSKPHPYCPQRSSGEPGCTTGPSGKALAPGGHAFRWAVWTSPYARVLRRPVPVQTKGGMARDTAPVKPSQRRPYLSGQTRAFTPAGCVAMPHTKHHRGRTTHPVSPSPPRRSFGGGGTMTRPETGCGEEEACRGKGTKETA